MPLVDTKKMLLEALGHGYTVGAFNITNLMEIEAVIEAAEEKKSPLIVQTTERVAKFLQPQAIIAVFNAFAEASNVPVALHLDHCTDVEFAKLCADIGYTSIMFDGSRKVFAENVRKTSQVVRYCQHKRGIPVEGELGTIGGREDRVESSDDPNRLCDPKEALEFVSQTGVDCLAPAIGTVHGIQTTAGLKIDFDRLRHIHELLNSPTLQTPLVVHGGTGIPLPSVKKLSASGAAKFNVGTDLKKALIDTTFDYISRHRREYLPENIHPLVKRSVKARVMHWMDTLDSSGRAVEDDASGVDIAHKGGQHTP